eukprot:m.64837 g.64837  ORF g.64837 m.64837 type:complete len:275 (-) comp13620_c0_seq1:325-1149(-)
MTHPDSSLARAQRALLKVACCWLITQDPSQANYQLAVHGHPRPLSQLRRDTCADSHSEHAPPADITCTPHCHIAPSPSHCDGLEMPCLGRGSVTVAFVLCVFEFLSLAWFSLVPLEDALHKQFPYNGTNTTDTDSFLAKAASAGFAYNTTGWSIAFSYLGLLLLTLLGYFWVFFIEFGVRCCCHAERMHEVNNGCCWFRFCGKCGILLWFVLPLLIVCVLFLVGYGTSGARFDTCKSIPFFFETLSCPQAPTPGCPPLQIFHCCGMRPMSMKST